jgi:type IV pilus assembly protein PilC
MPIYFYTAIGKTGEKVTGSEAAEDEKSLAKILQKKDYILTTAKIQEEKRKIFSLRSLAIEFRGVSLTDKLLFTRNLQVMVEAGIPLPKAFDVLVEQARNKRFKDALEDIKKSIVKGKTLSEALERYPKIFSELFVSMVRVGEESGTMEQILTQLSFQMDREHELKARVRGALMYPAVIVFAMIGVGTLMLAVVVPQLAAVFDDLGVELPLTTRVIIALGLFVTNYWFIVAPGFIAFLFLLYRFIKTKPGKRAFDTVSIRLPVLSGIIRKTNAALMTRTLSSLIFAGVPIVRALEITSRVVGNVHFQDSLSGAAKQVGKGLKISESLEAHKHIYPIVVIQMIAVGEETGETGKILGKLADFFEEEVTEVTKNLTSIIEPLLMLVIGAVVGFFAISMVQPMYSMLNSIQ